MFLPTQSMTFLKPIYSFNTIIEQKEQKILNIQYILNKYLTIVYRENLFSFNMFIN